MYHEIDSPGNILNSNINFTTKDYPILFLSFNSCVAYKTQTQYISKSHWVQKTLFKCYTLHKVCNNIPEKDQTMWI